MSDVAMKVEGMSKLYHIGAKQELRLRLSEQLMDYLANPFVRVYKLITGQVLTAEMLEEELWALKDVSFEIKQGEVVGVIGANGAGKSTLLKILSQITEPTEGYADIYGRIGSLLEVGTGFHPDLTGRENVYLNGAILGMRKNEIARKFDEIVEFAAIDKFIDTPIRHYSSGMYVRLAFAVAAHLEPEILIIDEVLAVGDIEFQKRCLGKMEDVASTGRTVVFVSHNMGLVQSLCQRGIFLREGRVVTDAIVGDAVRDYLHSFGQSLDLRLADRTDRTGEGEILFTDLEILNPDGINTRTLISGQPVRFVFRFTDIQPKTICSLTIFDYLGRPITRFQSSVASEMDVVDTGIGQTFICEVDPLFLTPGSYRLDVDVRTTGRLQDEIRAAANIDVHEGIHGGRRMLSLKGVNTFTPHRWIAPIKYHNI